MPREKFRNVLHICFFQKKPQRLIECGEHICNCYLLWLEHTLRNQFMGYLVNMKTTVMLIFAPIVCSMIAVIAQQDKSSGKTFGDLKTETYGELFDKLRISAYKYLEFRRIFKRSQNKLFLLDQFAFPVFLHSSER